MKKLKLISLLSVFALCLCTLGIGVWAARSASFNSSGTITFNAVNVEATVSGVVAGAKTNPTITTLEYGADKTPNSTALSSWSNNLEFDANGTNITLTITITNKSQDRDIWVYIHDEIGFTYNLKKEITDGGHARVISAKGDSADYNSETFTIQFSVYSIYANVGDGTNTPEYNFTVNIYDEGVIPSADAENENLNYVKSRNGEACVSGFKDGTSDTTNVNIKPLINIGGEICVVTKIEPKVVGEESDYLETATNVSLPYTLLYLDCAFMYTDIVFVAPYSVVDAQSADCIIYVDDRGADSCSCTYKSLFVLEEYVVIGNMGDLYVATYLLSFVKDEFVGAISDDGLWFKLHDHFSDGTDIWK